MVKKNRSERVQNTKEQLAAIQDRKRKVKAEMSVKLEERHVAVDQIKQNLNELRNLGEHDAEVTALMNELMEASNGFNDIELLSSEEEKEEAEDGEMVQIIIDNNEQYHNQQLQ